MPNQTSKKNFFFPDGCEVSISTDNGSSFFDVGAIEGDTVATLNYDTNQTTTANAGKTAKQAKNMNITGNCNIINYEAEVLEKISGGIITRSTVAGTPVASPDNQVVLSGTATDKTPYAMVIADAGVPFSPNAEPVITSVTGGTDGLLTVDVDYTIIPDTNASSGYSVVFNLAGTNLTTLAQDITIVYGSNTPIAETQLDFGSTTLVLDDYILRFTHYTDSAKTAFDRRLFIYSTNMDSGGVAFNFNGADSDGVEAIPFSFTGDLDTNRDDGKQLGSLIIR